MLACTIFIKIFVRIMRRALRGLNFICSYTETWPTATVADEILTKAEGKEGIEGLTDEEKKTFLAMAAEAGRMSVAPDAEYTLLTSAFVTSLNDEFERHMFEGSWPTGRNHGIRSHFVTYKGNVMKSLKREILEKVREAASANQKKIIDQMESKLRCLLYLAPDTYEYPLPVFCDNMVVAVQAHLARTPEVIKEVRANFYQYISYFYYFRPGSIFNILHVP